MWFDKSPLINESLIASLRYVAASTAVKLQSFESSLRACKYSSMFSPDFC